MGAMKIKEQYPDALLIFISAPSIDSLRDRLRGRGTEAEDVILKRLKKATEESADMDMNYRYQQQPEVHGPEKNMEENTFSWIRANLRI